MMMVKSGHGRGRQTLRRIAVLSLASVLTLSGCGEEMKKQISDRSAEAQAGLASATNPDVPVKHYNPLTVSDKVWAGNTALRMHRGMPLPARFETAHGVSLVASEPMNLADIIAALSRQTGIPIHVADIGAKAGGNQQQAANASALMSVAYEGPLSGLMERIAGHFGVNWRFDGSTISINKFETRVFTVEALPGSQSIQEGMQDDSSGSSSSSSGGSSGGSSSSQNTITQNSKFSIDIKYWDELGQILNSMLGGTGTVVVAPSLGTVTVTTTPEIMHTVADYLAQENQRISRQIAVNIEIYTVSLSSGMNFNTAFNTALNGLISMHGNISGVSAPTASNAFTGGGNLSLAVIEPRKFGSVTDIFTALSGIGNTSKIAKFPLITLNNRPVSRRIGTDTNYVASATSNTSGAGTTSTFSGTSLVPGTIHQGFSVQLTPRLLDDGRILLQYSLSIIDLLGIDSFNSVCGSSGSSSSSCTTSATAQGSSTVQLPKTANRIFVQQSVLKSGSTLFIGGVEEEDLAQNSQGLTDPDNFLFGGGTSTSTDHEMVFFALTPQVLDVPHSEKE